MSYELFAARMAEINDLLCAVNLLAWDSRTKMPPGGVEPRSQQIATLTGLARKLATGADMQRAMEGARTALAGSGDTLQSLALDQAERDIGILRRIPEALTAELAHLRAGAHLLWGEARKANDFKSFVPTLKRMMDLQRELASAIGYREHPYDALVGLYEPGMTLARLNALYGDLKSALRPLLDKALGAAAPDMAFLSRPYSIEAQKRFGLQIAEKFGYDLARGRLDDTVHPFEISMTREDARITSRFQQTWLPGGIFALWHEAGHGTYEQAIAPEFTRGIFATDLPNLYAVGGTSFGMHESQSRLWENRIGRSLRFWELHFGQLQSAFPDQLSGVTAGAFWRSVNRVRPSLIRIEADELTYDHHIVLRTEIEAGLMDGSISVVDLPEIWSEKMRSYLGLEVPDYASGVLQDVHWSHGYVGSFPTYTLGNIMSGQLFTKAVADEAVAQGLEKGDYIPLLRWLNANVHRFGRSRTPDEILKAATGSGLEIGPYIRILTDKVAALAA